MMTRHLLALGLLSVLGCDLPSFGNPSPTSSATTAASAVASALASVAAPPVRVKVQEAPAGPRVEVDGFKLWLDGTALEEGDPFDTLTERLTERRETWQSAHTGEAFPGVASLHVKPTTSSSMFEVTYRAIASAAYPHVWLQLGDEYLPFEPMLLGVPCHAKASLCLSTLTDDTVVLHAQGSSAGWTLRVPGQPQHKRTGQPSGATQLGDFSDGLKALLAVTKPKGVVVHVPPKAATFADFADYFAAVATRGADAKTFISTADIDEPTPDKEAIAAAEADSGVSGRLPPEVIQATVRRSFGHFRRCYEEELRVSPNARGRVTMRFVIARGGDVQSVVANVEPGLPSSIGPCMTVAMRGLQFPKPNGGIVTVSYPIVFSPGG